MIELRWVLRRRAFDPINSVPVLQYRQWRDGVWFEGAGIQSSGGSGRWSDWQDVPVVAEGE